MYKRQEGNGTVRVKWVKVSEHGAQEQIWGGIANTRAVWKPTRVKAYTHT